MQVKVKLFASVREVIGARELPWELPDGATVSDLMQAIDEAYPQAHLRKRALHVAINQKYADLDAPLKEGDEVAFLPPVSGGQELDGHDIYEVTEEPLSIDDLARAVGLPACGAIATFVGIVRDHTGERQVDHLEYEAYTPMAEKTLRQIGQEIRERWPSIRAVGIRHRIGRLEIGEASVVIAVAASHRADVFDACRYAIDRIKEIVPIWKKEFWTDGEMWIEGPHGVRTPEHV